MSHVPISRLLQALPAVRVRGGRLVPDVLHPRHPRPAAQGEEPAAAPAERPVTSQRCCAR